MTAKSYYIKLVPFEEPGTSYKNDFTVEVRHHNDNLYATFGGSLKEDKTEFIKRVAKNLNTIEASPIDKVLKDPELRSVSLPLKELQRVMKTGIKHEITRSPSSKKTSLSLNKEEELKKKKKKKRKGLFSSFS